MRWFRSCLLLVILLVLIRPVQATVVHDPGNAIIMIQQLAQQAQQIANQIQSINHQVTSLQNQARMLQNLQISNYEQAIAAMLQAQSALKQMCIDVDLVPNHIGYDTGLSCHDLLALYRKAYPQGVDWKSFDHEDLVAFPKQWILQKREAAAKAMQVQNASVDAMEDSAQRMGDLASASRSAPGTKSAQQVTNEMLVTISGQMRDQQATAVAAQRAEAMQQAEDASWSERNQELLDRYQRDAKAKPSVKPIRNPFRRN